MKANKIVLVPKYKSKTILFKVIPYKSYKTQIEQKAQMKLISAFDFYNSGMLSDTLDDNLFKTNNDDFHINSVYEYYDEEYPSVKLVNPPFFQKSLGLINNEKEKAKEKLKAGRKKKNSFEVGNHNKYTADNIIRKCKTVMINILFNFINKTIKDTYKKGYENSWGHKKLMKMNQSQIISSSVQENKSFLNKKLKDIFSENLSKSCS